MAAAAVMGLLMDAMRKMESGFTGAGARAPRIITIPPQTHAVKLDLPVKYPGNPIVADVEHGVSVLEPAVRQGALPLALHPVMTFTGRPDDVDRLAGTSFGVTAPEVLIRPIWLPLDSVNQRFLSGPAVILPASETRNSVREPEGVEEMIGAPVALIGASGVGKSTLANRLAGEELQDPLVTFTQRS